MTTVRTSTVNAVRVQLRTPNPPTLGQINELIEALTYTIGSISLDVPIDAADGGGTRTVRVNPSVLHLQLGSLEIVLGITGVGAASVAIVKGIVELLDRIRDRARREEYLTDEQVGDLLTADIKLHTGPTPGMLRIEPKPRPPKSEATEVISLAEQQETKWVEDLLENANDAIADLGYLGRLDRLPDRKTSSGRDDFKKRKRTIRLLHGAIEFVEEIEYR